MATDPVSAVAAIFAKLQALPGITVYDGFVPTKVPTDTSGYIKPYVVLFAGVGGDLPAERDLTQLADAASMNLAFQTNCVAASAGICRAVAHDVRQTLLNVPLAGGFIKPDDGSFDTATPIPDTTITPVRLFLPLPWRLTTT